MTDLSVIIPTSHASGARLREFEGLLRDIRQQTSAPNFEVLVVANPPNSSLESKIGALGDPRFHYIKSDAMGANRARNRGIEEARGDILLFLDDDCRIISSDFLRRHFDLHNQFGAHTALGGRYLLNPNASLPDRVYLGIQDHWLIAGRLQGHKVRSLLGGNVSFKRGVFKKFLFNEALHYGGTETELFARLEQEGLTCSLHAPLAIEHRPGLSGFSLVRKGFSQGQGAAFIEKLMGPSARLPRRIGDLPLRERIYTLAFEFGFDCGHQFGSGTGATQVSSLQFYHQLLRGARRKMIRLPHTAMLTHLYYHLKFYFRSAPKSRTQSPPTNAGPPA